MNTLPDIKQDFSAWYNEIIFQAELADHAPVRGCMIVRPYGCAIWDLIKQRLDERIKATGHDNALFPLFIPESFLKREAEHVEGFAPELAIVTYAGGKQLEEPLVVRPTSETIIHYMFSKWIKSWRDLPLKINQWANVVRWEMRPRPFLRTTEFFWQEGHTAHATREEADKEVALMLHEYVQFAYDYLAIPVVTGQKTESEKFPGAVETYTFEGLMQDGKALQMGTSHLLSQDFAKAFEILFQDQEGKQTHPWLTSWGATTRLVGATVMVHGDEKGLVLPPKVAPYQVVIIPIFKKGQDNEEIIRAVTSVAQQLTQVGIRVKTDLDDSKTPGSKFYHWELRGVPVRIEIGPKDLEKGAAMVSDRLGIAKQSLSLQELTTTIPTMLTTIHTEMLERARKRRDAQWYKMAKLKDFGPLLDTQPGFYQTGFCGNSICESQLKEYKATTRCLINEYTFSECFVCQNPSNRDVLIAKSY
jgi:prolyl-tRNA synthetase